MAGITSYGAYMPLWRLSRATIAQHWGDPPMPGERSVANFDEDSITMAVGAAIDCLKGFSRQVVDRLLFASTTSPYEEKQAATTVAAAADLRRDMVAADYTNSLRAGTVALRAALDSVKAGSAKQALVTAADMRTAYPRSAFEQSFGDGAAALLIGDENVIAEVEAEHSITHEITDLWRAEGTPYTVGWEDRFIFEQGYFKAMREAATQCAQKCGLDPKQITKAAYYAPDARRHMEMARTLGLDYKTQAQDPLFANMGCTGAAHALMILVAALEEAKAGDRILLLNYGDGADAIILRVTENIEKVRNRRGIKGHLEPKRMVPDYTSYARWRGIIEVEKPRRPPIEIPSPTALWRERDQILRLHGGKCNNCGTVQYPPQRVCTRCHAKDNFETVSLADKGGTLFTYAMDYIAGTMDIPLIISVVNFNGGGRIMNTMTDRDINEIKVGMPVDMSFRKLFTVGGIHNYFWKAIPVRG